MLIVLGKNIKNSIYEAKIKKRIEKIQEEFTSYPFNSGYFMCLKLKKGLNTEEIRGHLLNKYSTGVITFGDVIRLAFSAVPQSKIPDLVENLYNACKDFDKN